MVNYAFSLFINNKIKCLKRLAESHFEWVLLLFLIHICTLSMHKLMLLLTCKRLTIMWRYHMTKDKTDVTEAPVNFGANLGLMLDLYDDYLQDPSSVPDDLQVLFGTIKMVKLIL